MAFSSKNTIVRWLKEFEIPLRSSDQALKLNRGQLAFGEKRVNGRIKACGEELATLQKMRDLRKLGYGYQKIADILNTMGVKTKKNKKWHLTSIKNTLKINSDD